MVTKKQLFLSALDEDGKPTSVQEIYDKFHGRFTKKEINSSLKLSSYTNFCVWVNVVPGKSQLNTYRKFTDQELIIKESQERSKVHQVTSITKQFWFSPLIGA